MGDLSLFFYILQSLILEVNSFEVSIWPSQQALSRFSLTDYSEILGFSLGHPVRIVEDDSGFDSRGKCLLRGFSKGAPFYFYLTLWRLKILSVKS